MSKNRFVVYTAVFGKKDALHTPNVIPEGWDFVGFTDQPLKSSIWQIRPVTAPLPDPTRSARMYKILPHRFLPEYEISMWIDGNVLLRGNFPELVDRYLKDANLAVLDHSACKSMPLGTLKAHEARLLWMESIGKHQEDPVLVTRQGDHYRSLGYPDTQGLAWTMVLLRRHNEVDVKETMELWWKELSEWSKRDQMSFNYSAWKTNLRFNYIPIDGMDNEYFKRVNHFLPWHRKLYSYVLGGTKRIKALFGAS